MCCTCWIHTCVSVLMAPYSDTSITVQVSALAEERSRSQQTGEGGKSSVHLMMCRLVHKGHVVQYGVVHVFIGYL